MKQINPTVNLIKALAKYLHVTLLKSPESKVLAVFMVVSLVVSVFNRANLFIILFKIIVYLPILSSINCMIYGDCRYGFGMFFLFSIPLLGIIIQILDLLGWFESQKGDIKKLYEIINKFATSDSISLVLEDQHDEIREKVKGDVNKLVEL